MRTHAMDSVVPRDEDLLTTGEAARILGTSRQHVVDLCERGDLPFATTGRHRRVRRGDLDALRGRTARMTRDQERSLWLGCAVAGKLVADPVSVIGRARENVRRLRAGARGSGERWLGEWEQLLDGQVLGVLDALTSRAPRARELRQNSPFAGVLSEDERIRVLEGFAAVKAGARR